MKKILSISFLLLLLGQLAFGQMPGVDIRPPSGNGSMHYKSNDNMQSNFTPTLAQYPLMPYATCQDLRRGNEYQWNTVSWASEDVDDGTQAQVAYTVTNPASNIAGGWDSWRYNRMTVNYTTAGPDTMRIDLPLYVDTTGQMPGEIFVVDINNSRTVDADTLLIHFDSLFRTYDGQIIFEWKCPPRGRIWMAFRAHVTVEGYSWVEVDDILGSYQHGSGGGGGAQVFTQVQTAHGFTAGQLIYFHDAATAELAKSDVGTADSVAQWAVHTIVNDSTFTYCNTCEVSLTTGFTPGSYIWTSTTPGGVTNVQPTSTNCQYAGVVRTDSTVWVHVGDLCGGSGAGGDGIYGGDGTAPADVDVTVTNSINFDAGTLFLDGVANKIGIGTVSPASKLDITTNNLGVTQTNTSGIVLANNTAATAVAQQMSPGLRWRGNGWKITATAESQTVDFLADVLPVLGTTAPTGTWRLRASINGGAYNTGLSFSSAGILTVPSSIVTQTAKFDIYDGGSGNMIFTPSTASNFGKIRFNYGSSSAEGMRLDNTGFLGIGTTSPGRLLHTEVSDAVTNAVTYTDRNTHITSGTATTGFGVGKEWELENDSGTNRVAATEEITWTDATNATEDAKWTLKLQKAGTNTEAISVDGTGQVVLQGPIRLKIYTVAALPTGTIGDTAMVTDATAPTYLGTLTGGGAVVCPVFFDGSVWRSH